MDDLLFQVDLQGDIPDIIDFLRRVWPLDEMPSTDPRFKTAAQDVWQHVVNNDDWDQQYLYMNYLQLRDGPDDELLRLMEAIVHPEVRRGTSQETCVDLINRYIEPDGFSLKKAGEISGYPIYTAVSNQPGKRGNAKNLIFAADGPKPEIVFSDAVDNEIQITSNAEYCLVYDRPIGSAGLLYSELVDWWADREGLTDTRKAPRSLYERLEHTLGSIPERVLFRSYYKLYATWRGRLPALIPQVYLHYDPYTERDRGRRGPLARQRMDFLLLLPRGARVIVEVDGKQHYADGDLASPKRYAQMVAEDRRLRLNGYEVYRFGGAELRRDDATEEMVQRFFEELFGHHGLATATAG